MFKPEFILESPDLWCIELNKSLPSILTTDGLKIKEELGTGDIRYLQIQNGLWINQINLSLNKPIELLREAKQINDYFILNFHLSKSKIKQSGDGKAYHLGLENVNILLASSATTARIFVPSDVPIKIFNIGFTMEWLKKTILDTDNSVDYLFPETQPIYLCEVIDYKFKKILKEIDINQNRRLTLFSNTLQLLDYFFARLKKREQSVDNFEGIHPDDLSKLMLAKESINNDVNSTISVEQLSKIAGMSLSKFKRLFKQVFGTTPYKYYLETKMEVAMELLMTKKYTCSEVGHIIGYSNLSQFSKAFKNHFNILPKNVK